MKQNLYEGLMTQGKSDTKTIPAAVQGTKFLSRIGPFAVVLAIACALLSFFVFAGLSPVEVDDRISTLLLTVDSCALLLLVAVVAAEGSSLVSAWRAGAAAARLHFRIVRVFSIIAAMPAIIIAILGTIALDRSISPGFMQDIRAFIFNTAEAARLFQQSQCRSLLQEAQLTAADLDRAKPMYDANRALFHSFFESRAKYLGFSSAALIRESGDMLDSADFSSNDQIKAKIVWPEPSDFEESRKGEATCIVADEGQTFIALRQITAFPDVYLYVTRPIDPFTREFPQQAANLISIYNGFETHRRNILIAFAAMFGLLALILLLSAMWLGLEFANRLVAPIRQLIAATDAVSTGNLLVRVPIDKSEGDLAHLGETFNKMTNELRRQQSSLMAASHLIDERRVFTEAVLSGVPAAVMGVGPGGLITVLNPSAERLLAGPGLTHDPLIGQPVTEKLPEIAPVMLESAGHMRPVQSQITLMLHGRERIVNIRVTSSVSDNQGRSYVITLDDITDLVTAQRSSAWADVARRIAHEIKNPLTPIQLSAERLKRKYSKHITVDRDIFDQCTDTIVRQVDDIKRMVDEFSSFARMPKARPERDDLVQCVKQVLFLMRVGYPAIEFAEDFDMAELPANFDRRLISQALTNIVKNATEGVEAGEGKNGPGRIKISVTPTQDGFAIIDIIDNGLGFPAESRQRLLEPYMTTRAEGTGLGLPIVAKIMEEHGGGIELLDASDGPGACVRLTMRLEGKAVARSPGSPETTN